MRTKYQNRLREIRKRQGIKQVELAVKSAIAISTVNRLECWPFPASIEVAEKLAAALGCRPTDIFPYLVRREPRP